jgi:hypothetical protein
MHFFSTVADTFAQRLKQVSIKAGNPSTLVHIRQEMLKLLPAMGQCLECDRVRRHLLVASDVRSLWFLRTNLHQQLSRIWGERIAMQKVNALWPLFEGQIAPSLLGKRPARFRCPGDLGAPSLEAFARQQAPRNRALSNASAGAWK